jgi:polyhydroxyalkanoate synthesis regulator phasin
MYEGFENAVPKSGNREEEEGDHMAPVAAKKSASKKSKENGLMKIADRVQSLTENLRKDLSKRVGGAGNEAKARTAKLAVMLIKLQRSTFDKAFKILSQVQERGDKLIKEHVEEGAWLPAEGKEVVKEWSRTLNDGRAEFQKTADKSYDLIRAYFERIQKAKPAARKAAASTTKGPARKKPAAKKAKVAKHKAAHETMRHSTM